MPLLVANKVFFKRNFKIIINELCFNVLPGYLLLLKGDNGAGKSTLLKMISGLLPLHAGKIFFNGLDIDKNKNIYQKSIIYMSDKCSLKKELSILENIKYLALIRGYLINFEKINNILSYLNLENVKHLKVKEISKGQKQRVLLSLLILMQKKLWLLDEPTANLDTKGKFIFNKILLNHLKNDGIAIISIHDRLNYFFFEYKYDVLNLNRNKQYEI